MFLIKYDHPLFKSHHNTIFYLITNNDYMKSEFYREISQEQKTRKSTAKNKIKKDMQSGELINPMKMNKGMKSVQRGQIHSIDVSKRMKIDHD